MSEKRIRMAINSLSTWRRLRSDSGADRAGALIYLERSTRGVLVILAARSLARNHSCRSSSPIAPHCRESGFTTTVLCRERFEAVEPSSEDETLMAGLTGWGRVCDRTASEGGAGRPGCRGGGADDGGGAANKVGESKVGDIVRGASDA